MSFIDGLRYRLRVLLQRNEYGHELEREVEHHLELETAAQRHAERAPSGIGDARRRAVRAFGNVTYATEERRIVSGLSIVDAVRQDVQFVLRVFQRRRVFAAVTIGTIALGIGAATSIFSVADIVLFRALDFPDPDRLVAVWETRPELKSNPIRAAQWDRNGFSLPMFTDWRATQTSFEDVALWARGTSVVGGTVAPEEVGVIRASASLIPILGIRMARGRAFTGREDAVGGAPVALVSYETWMSRMAGDSGIIGQRVMIDGVAYSIIGVLPPGLTLERRPKIASYWIPAGQDAEAAGDRGAYDFQAIARLKRDASIDAATDETARLVRAAQPHAPVTHGARLVTLRDEQTRDARAPILILLGAAGLLLLIACANVATLLMGEASNREIELRARIALGATRTRLVRQLLTESVVLGLVGGILGAMLAYAGTRLIVRFAPPWIPGLASIRVDTRVLAAALIASCLTGVIFGIVPALLLSRTNDGTSLRLGGQSARGRGRSQGILIAGEVALSMVLLISAGLLVQSFARITAVDPGFRKEQLLVVRMRLPQPAYSDSVRFRALCRDLVAAVGALPGVTSVATTTTPPFSGGSSSSNFEVEGRVLPVGTPQPDAQRRITTPGYLATAGIPIIDGRAYTDADGAGAPPVVVVSQALARREWPNESAVGKRIKWMGVWRTVIGVAADIKLRTLFDTPPAAVYAPLAQLFRQNAPSLVVRMNTSVSIIAPAIRSAMHDIAPDVPITGMDEMNSLVSASLSDERFRTELMSLFAALAALLAAVGMYGVAATSASRRTREMAIRAALGATSASIVRLIVGAGVSGVAAGATVGLGLAMLAARVLSPYLYGVGPLDAVTYGAVLALLAFITVGASWVPARRASRVPLVDTLRRE